MPDSLRDLQVLEQIVGCSVCDIVAAFVKFGSVRRCGDTVGSPDLQMLRPLLGSGWSDDVIARVTLLYSKT